MNEHERIIMEREGQNELWPDLKTEHQWYHIVRSTIMRGDMAKMGTVAWAVYSVLKAHTSLNDGKSWPSQARIAELVGCSVDTVARATEKLIEMEYVKRTKKGNRNEYIMKESIPVTTQQGQMIARGESTYVPMQFERIINDIKTFAESGAIRTGSPVEIKLNINIIQQGDNSTVNINNVEVKSDDNSANQAYTLLVNKLNKLV